MIKYWLKFFKEYKKYASEMQQVRQQISPDENHHSWDLVLRALT